MEFYPDDRYRHDNKHNKCNSNLECMRLEDLLVCPKCHCVVLMKPEKRINSLIRRIFIWISTFLPRYLKDLLIKDISKKYITCIFKHFCRII